MEEGGWREVGRGFELFDKVSRATVYGMTITPTRESGMRVKDTSGKKGP